MSAHRASASVTARLSPRSPTLFLWSQPRTSLGREIALRNRAKLRDFATTTAMSGPPKHKLVHFKGLTKDVRATGNFRSVLHTGLYSQLVSMEIPVGGEIGEEVHTVDQILIFTAGKCKAIVANQEEKDVSASDLLIVPAGTNHNVVNTGDVPLELFTIYSPAEHAATSEHKTKEEGDAEEESGRDEAPEWSRKTKDENEKAGLVKVEGGPYNE